MKWDLNYLFNQGHENDHKYTIREDASLALEDFDKQIREAGLEVPTQPPPEMQDSRSFDDVKPSAAEEVVREGVKGAVQGYFFDVKENILTSLEDYEPDALYDKKLVFNIPGLKNHDPARPFVFTMDEEEFESLKEEKRISYLPQFMNKGTATYEFTRTMGSVLNGLKIGGTITKPFTSVYTPLIKGSKQVQSAAGFVAPGLVGSQISFNPYDDRASNMINEIIQDTPFEVASPFFEWLQADDSNTEAEERFKMALESIVLDAAFGTVFKLYKARRDILKGTLFKKSPEEIAEIERQNLARLNDKKVKKEELPTSSPEYTGKSPATKVLNAKLEDPTIFASPDAAKRIVETLVRGDFRDINPTGYRVFNTKYLEDEGASEALNAFETLIRKEMQRKVPGLDTPKGPKTLEEINKSGMELADTIQGQRIITVAEDTATQLGIDKDLLMELMMKDLNDVAGIEARILAYRGVISQYGAELQQIRKAIQNDPENNPVLRARFVNLISQTEDALRVFGEVRRTVARATTAQRIKIPKTDKVSQSEMTDLFKALEESGMDSKKMNILAETLGMAKGPLHSVRIAQLGKETLMKRGGRALIEFYRGMLLASMKTHITNVVSGTAETLLVPVTRMAGSVLMRDREVMKETTRHLHGLLWSMGESANKFLDALLHERNILDPMGTKIDGLVSNYGNAISMSKVRDATWHPANYLTYAVNFVGKVARGSMRLLGAEDEFFKQLNYRAQAFAKITKDMPEGMSRIQRKAYISREMDNYFDDIGRATDEDMLQYSRKITFTEELRPGSYGEKLHRLSVNNPPLQLFFPFVRTPINIFGRYAQRTPLLNQLQASHREMLASSDNAIRAQAIGNTALGVTLYGAALGYVYQGSVTGPGPLDPDRNKIWRQAGNQPYSIKLPSGNWMSYNRLDPTFMPLVFIASAVENAHTFAEKDDTFAEMGVMGVLGMMKALSDRTYLSGLKTMLETVTMVTTGNLDRVGQPLSRMGASMVPSVIGQFGDIFPMEGAEGFREAISWQEQFLRRAPQLTGYNAIKHNWLTGKPVISPFGYNTGIPVSDEQANPYLMEIVRMGRSIQPPDIRIGNVELTGPQYAELNRLIGTVEIGGLTLMDQLVRFMDSREYDYDPNRYYNPDYDDYRVAGVKTIIRDYKALGKRVLLSQDQSLLDQVVEDRANMGSVMTGGQQLFELNQR